MVRVDQRKENKRMKKRVTPLLLTGVLMVMSSVPTMAAVARVPIGPCPKCGVQACSTTESTGYEHDELFACKHGKSGYDRYRVYKTVTRKNCSNCGYSSTSKETETHKFYKCEGK